MIDSMIIVEVGGIVNEAGNASFCRNSFCLTGGEDGDILKISKKPSDIPIKGDTHVKKLAGARIYIDYVELMKENPDAVYILPFNIVHAPFTIGPPGLRV